MNNLDGIYNEKAMAEKKVRDGRSTDEIIDTTVEKMIQKYGEDTLTGILPLNKTKEYYSVMNHKVEDFHIISFEDEGIPKERDSTNVSLKARIRKLRVKDDKKPIPKIQEPTDLDLELVKNPDLAKFELYFSGLPYQKQSLAQKLNTYEWTNQFGKIVNEQTGSTRTGRIISRLPQHNFGSIIDYSIDTLPLSHIRCKGTEITYVTNKYLQHKNIHLLSRLFASNVLSFWCYVLDIYYLPNEKHLSGINIWSTPLKMRHRALNEFQDTTFFVTGEQLKLMLYDFIFLIRSKSTTKLPDLIQRGQASEQLYNTLDTLRRQRKCGMDTILLEIKDRLYYDMTTKEYQNIWGYPKLHVSYLYSLISELRSGKYYLDILIPLIKDMKHYPIICKDTHVKPLTHEQHQQNKDDYDILQHYIEERF